MDHPNIARVLDAGTDADGRPFFVTELIKGVPITQFCDARKLTPRERLELFVPVCEAIQYAHQKGVIHRDIKPSNVLVALYDDRMVPKVLDFGVARAVGRPLADRPLDTGPGSVVGVPAYMSPEQAAFNNPDIDTRSDLYSLGALLYELLTGSPPFTPMELEGARPSEVLRAVREIEPTRPSTRLSTSAALPTIAADRRTEPKTLTALLRNELDWVVMKALEKDRGRRYATAAAFAADIRRHLTNRPVLAVPPSAAYRLRTFVRRHNARVAVTTVLFLALIGTAGGTMSGAIKARNEQLTDSPRRQAEEARDAAERVRAGEETARQSAESARREAARARDGETEAPTAGAR
ncbi:serine/threonine-protein kinase [Fimbriiglobus ruber]|nr:serine/threonine-protein kinase [Fimbriiglobus ruber]